MTAPPVARPNPAADLAAWSRVTRRIHVWDYMVNFNNLLVPYPNWFVLGKVRPMQSSPLALQNKNCTELAQIAGQLQGSHGDFQSKCWAKSRKLGQPCTIFVYGAPAATRIPPSNGPNFPPRCG